ncbi:MAG: methyltransferase domain-containing protein [Gammaproteobacteria bacterium]|nr:methyltransferase domain-containing protein [Gammaproteobacteria bacterium]
MKQAYWDGLSETFDDEVFDPVKNDLNKVIRSSIEKFSHPQHTAIDIGCGNGRNLGSLSLQFKTVLGIDISPDCLQLASEQFKSRQSVECRQLDLSQCVTDVEKADLGLCLNVVMMQSFETRQRLLQNITSLIKPKGRLLLLVPSLESVLLTLHRLILWNLEEHANYKQAAAAANNELGFSARYIRDGMVNKGGTPTKHYIKEELELLISSHGHRVCDIKKVEYSWKTEFANPPATMSAPYPWDWLVISTPH